MKPQTSHRPAKLGELYDQLLIALYERPDADRARHLADQLADQLSGFGSGPESIFMEECRSLIAETHGDLPNAIKHRENEIRLIRRLHELSVTTDSQSFVFSQYDYSDLRDRLNLLAMLYHDNGNPRKAIRTLEESKRLCADHRIKFDGGDLLRDYLAEQPQK